MSRELQYILVIVGWLVVAVLIIIPRLMKKKNVSTHATNATNADIVKAIYSLKDTIYNLKDTIYAVMMILITAMMALK